MESELTRLASFSKWSKECKFSPMQLARCGFYYCSVTDRLVCHACGDGFVTESIDDEENLMERHRYLSPNCTHHSREDISGASSFFTSGKVKESSNDSLENLFVSALNRADTKRLFDSYTTRSPSVDRIDPDFDLLRSERVRLTTFHDWSSAARTDPDALARDGFFYSGFEDRVQCAFCREFLSKWQLNDVPRVEHSKHFPDCPFVRGLDVGNVPIEEASCTESWTTSSSSSDEETKLEQIAKEPQEQVMSNSDTHRPRPNEIRIFRPNHLGFNREVDVRKKSIPVRAVLNMGYSEGAVRMALSKKLTETGTDFPNAESLLEAIFQLEDEEKTRLNSDPAAATPETNQSSMFATSSYSPTDGDVISMSTDSGIFASGPALHSVASLPAGGSSLDHLHDLLASSETNQPEIQTAMTSSGTSGSREFPEMETTATVMQPIKTKTRSKRKGKKNKNRKKNRNKDSEQEHLPEMDSDSKIDEASDNEAVRYLNENQQLREARTCKVCMDAEVNTVFLPCGHLVCCDRCSHRLRDCPICRNFIRGTVKTVLR